MEAKGSLFRGYLTKMAEAGVLDAVKAKLPPETRRLADNPPLVSTWVAVHHQDALLGAFADLCGVEACADLGYAVTRDSLSTFIKPVVTTILKLIGPSPHKVYARLDQIASTTVRPVKFAYTEVAETAGRLAISTPRPVPEPGHWAWRGGLRYAFDLCRCRGTVSRPEIKDGGRSASYDVRWS